MNTIGQLHKLSNKAEFNNNISGAFFNAVKANSPGKSWDALYAAIAKEVGHQDFTPYEFAAYVSKKYTNFGKDKNVGDLAKLAEQREDISSLSSKQFQTLLNDLGMKDSYTMELAFANAEFKHGKNKNEFDILTLAFLSEQYDCEENGFDKKSFGKFMDFLSLTKKDFEEIESNGY